MCRRCSGECAADDVGQRRGARPKARGVLRLYSPGSPANMSMLESPTIQSEMPTMGVFNNLIMFDQHVARVSLQSIVPDLATSWAWNEDGTELSFKLRSGVKWHDGKPFTARDVQCTWDLILDKGARSSASIRARPLTTTSL